MSQLNLNFHNIPIPETHLWEQFDDEQRRVVLEILSRLIARMISARSTREASDE